MEFIGTIFSNLAAQTGFAYFTDFRQVIMILLACVLLYLGIVKKFEPLLLVGIAFGMLLTNLPGSGVYHPELWYASGSADVNWSAVLHDGGLLDLLYLGVKLGIYPSLIFMGVGAMTDFGPMMANPKSMLLGAAAQFGVYVALVMAVALGFKGSEAASIAIIGGADGPTAIWLTKTLAPHLLGPIAIAAYSYMALIPLIQPPIMMALTTKKEREVKMEQLRSVSQALGLGDIAGEQQSQKNSAPTFASSGGQPQIDMNTVLMLQRAMSAMGQEDKNTELLRALKPHFSPERAKKVDDAIKIMQLIRLLPMAKELGLFDKLKGGG